MGHVRPINAPLLGMLRSRWDGIVAPESRHDGSLLCRGQAGTLEKASALAGEMARTRGMRRKRTPLERRAPTPLLKAADKRLHARAHARAARKQTEPAQRAYTGVV
jgi:hypothetical protein